MCLESVRFKYAVLSYCLGGIVCYEDPHAEVWLHTPAPTPALVPSEFLVPLLRLLAKLPELFGIVQNMGIMYESDQRAG